MFNNNIYLRLIIILMISALCSSKSVAQEMSDSIMVVEAKEIYRNMEYSTVSFDDLKPKWYITDPVFVREIFNRIVVKNALRYNGEKPSRELLEEKVEDVYNGSVFIELRRRYYDDEIEILRFFSEANLNNDSSDYFFDPLIDYVMIRDIVGVELYDNLKQLFYSHTDLTKKSFDNQLMYSYDIYLNLFRPKLMFWTLTTQARNKYLLSFFGQWGNDYISIPGWHYPAYFSGIELTYIDSVVNNQPKFAYSANIGISTPVREPQLKLNTDEFGQRLFYTGTQFYMKLQGNPLIFIDPELDDFDFTLEFVASMSENSVADMGINYDSKFFSTRNYFVLFARYNDLMNFMDMGWLHAGFGITAYDVEQYLLDPRQTSLQSITSDGIAGWKAGIAMEGGISNFGGLLQYNFDLLLNFNFSDALGGFGFKSSFTISNNIGFEFKYLKSIRLSSDPLPFYKLDSYLVFSPIIRINY
ncbi:MAG: hypothetical protein K9J12_05820 [Melioribacteraceae bacterium]|nr:hypothetical protein [Melioribacteraceae bacterium]MCF8265343.1 hypothetical protein [Melioribacteraceae bacterium]